MKKAKSQNKKTVHRLPDDFREKIESKDEIKAIWDTLTPIARNEWICWVISAKKEETRAKRIDRGCEDLLAGKRRPCCWPGCPHRNKNTAKWHHGT